MDLSLPSGRGKGRKPTYVSFLKSDGWAGGSGECRQLATMPGWHQLVPFGTLVFAEAPEPAVGPDRRAGKWGLCSLPGVGAGGLCVRKLSQVFRGLDISDRLGTSSWVSQFLLTASYIGCLALIGVLLKYIGRSRLKVEFFRETRGRHSRLASPYSTVLLGGGSGLWAVGACWWLAWSWSGLFWMLGGLVIGHSIATVERYWESEE